MKLPSRQMNEIFKQWEEESLATEGEKQAYLAGMMDAIAYWKKFLK